MIEQAKTGESKKKHNIYTTAETLRSSNKNTHDFVIAVGKFIHKHLKSFNKLYKTKNILESRFTSPENAFDKGMSSCGALTNISAAMLRSTGVKIRLIHGTHKKSRNHAWISVFEPEKEKWIQYDFTNSRDNNYSPDPDHKIKTTCNDWEEIRSLIEEEHRAWLDAKKD